MISKPHISVPQVLRNASMYKKRLTFWQFFFVFVVMLDVFFSVVEKYQHQHVTNGKFYLYYLSCHYARNTFLSTLENVNFHSAYFIQRQFHFLYLLLYKLWALPFHFRTKFDFFILLLVIFCFFTLLHNAMIETFKN